MTIFPACGLLAAVLLWWSLLSKVEGSTSEETCTTGNDHQTLRILCYGDSLTAGESPPSQEFYPYATYLQAALQEQLPGNVHVQHIGLCGWTTQQMIQVLDDPTNGLRHAATTSAYDFVVLLAGTNDLWPQNLNPNADNEDVVTEVVVENLHQLRAAAKTGSPKTVVLQLGIPSSVYQERENRHAQQVAQNVNRHLMSLASSSSFEFLYFPFAYYDEAGHHNEENWSYDGIHFSPRGYEVLGESVAARILELLAQESSSSCRS